VFTERFWNEACNALAGELKTCGNRDRVVMSESAALLMDAGRLQKLRAPSADGGTLIIPPFSKLAEVAQANTANLANCSTEIGGVPRSELAVQARTELIRAAVRWTQGYRKCSLNTYQDSSVLTPVYMTGHQPELFHPGVWFKNAVLHHAAVIGRGVAIHLVVDNDTLKSSSVRILTGDSECPQIMNVPIDGGPSGIPYEDRLIHDWDGFQSFGKRVKEYIGGMVPDPLIDEFWPLVQNRARMTGRLGDAIAQGRHLWEERWGWNTLEIPQSVVCEQDSFLRLVLHLWVESHRFQQIHNQAVLAYRRWHRLRSRSHPFPELQQVDRWYETPFWTWTIEEPVRRRIFVRHGKNVLEVTDGGNCKREIPHRDFDLFQTFVNWWRDEAEKGRRIRSRAVITTLWARLCLSDLFIHGIGGAKYDGVTDEIIRRFFHCEPPPFCTATATLRLPVACSKVDAVDISRLRQLIRETEFHPERFIDLERLPPSRREDAENVIRQKWEWIRQLNPSDSPRQRFLAIRECNKALQEFVTEDRRELERLLQVMSARLRTKQILSSRDWPFCIYSLDQLDRFFLSVTQSAPTC